jgi:hypothetical protein
MLRLAFVFKTLTFWLGGHQVELHIYSWHVFFYAIIFWPLGVLCHTFNPLDLNIFGDH